MSAGQTKSGRRTMSRQQYESLCGEACSWVGPEKAKSVDEGVLWSAIYEDVSDYFGRQIIVEKREAAPVESCRAQIRQLVEYRRSEPFDALGIARQHINQALRRCSDFDTPAALPS